MGGGTTSYAVGDVVKHGLSPRGRGNPVKTLIAVDNQRSIPAWAGEPPKGAALACGWEVYPRVGGGTIVRVACPTRG